ncbi:DNA/RNA helicase [Paenibacillus sediminis]|uniref:Heat induced stress protein YflT n=1 Tax=Paenibacillus sediminis TaxID=664909 RepID=A0ABS4H722_9BACL|nr:DNA/RNA helicase [Paenibacillus sediminis]MBP1938032.1 hypothetical protein [Paenibacillus sediminis]
MQETAITFQFPDPYSANQALDTLQELGYRPVHASYGNALHVHMDHQDITSMLEIAQAHGGVIMNAQSLSQDNLLYGEMGVDDIPIPAHVVNEDFSELYSSDKAEQSRGSNTDHDENNHFGESYGGFSGDVNA